MSSRPIHILELRSVWGTGGGPEKTILSGAASTDSRQFSVTVCYIRDRRDRVFGIDQRAHAMGLDYVEVQEKHSFDPSIWPRLRRLVHERQIDIVHGHDYKTNLIALLLGLADGAIPLSTVHGWTGHTPRQKFYYFFDKRLLARFPRVIAVSGEIRATLLQVGAAPERVSIVLNGIDHRAFRRDRGRQASVRSATGIAPHEIVLGAVGRVERQKRFDLLLDAFARLREQRPNLRLLIVGDGELRAPLEAAAERLKLGATCRFLGHRLDVSALHHAFDLFVQSSDYEGTPNAVLEAMALETPIVATDVGGTGELIVNGVHGLLVPPGDPDALARAIDLTLADQNATARRVQAARARVEQELSFDARTRAVEQIYEELVAAYPAGWTGGATPWWRKLSGKKRRHSPAL